MPVDQSARCYAENEFVLLADLVDAHREDLVRRSVVALRQHIFTNHIELRPQHILRIAEQEPDALIAALRNSFEGASEHGVELCRAGLGIQSVMALIEVLSDFFMISLVAEPMALKLASPYPVRVLDGFVKQRENVIIHEQEKIRSAFEIAIARANFETLQAQLLVQKTNELSYQKIISAQEDERRRISRELHDEAGQALVSIRMSLENLSATCNHENPEIKNGLDKAIAATNKAMDTIRTLALRLRPPMLDLLGLNLALRQLCIDNSEQSGLQINYSGQEIPHLTDELSINIYRIVQEALTNTIKHAHAKHAWIWLRASQEEITLSISDDGQGFNPENTRKGIGLDGMRERSLLLNGKMEVVSKIGSPAQLIFSFPLDTNR